MLSMAAARQERMALAASGFLPLSFCVAFDSAPNCCCTNLRRLWRRLYRYRRFVAMACRRRHTDSLGYRGFSRRIIGHVYHHVRSESVSATNVREFHMKFSKEEKERMVHKIREYFEQELDVEIGGFQAEFLIDFIGDEFGAYFYNRGIYDAEALLNSKVAEISDALLELEKPVS